MAKPPPVIKSNSPELTAAFAAVIKYVQDSSRENGGGLTAGKGVRILPTGVIELTGEEFSTPLLWQLIRRDKRLYINPAHAILIEEEHDGGAYTFKSMEPHIGEKSIFEKEAPFWNLPLAPSSAFSIFIIINPCKEEEDASAEESGEPLDPSDDPNIYDGGMGVNGSLSPSSAKEVWLELVPGDALPDKVRTEGGWAFKVHEFDTDTDGNPILSVTTQRMRSEPMVLKHFDCPSSSSSSESSDSSDSSDPSDDPPSDPGDSSASSDSSDSSGDSSGDSDGSDKSTAIVPVTWPGTGYAALFCVEMPEVRFEDIQLVRITGRFTSVPVCTRFQQVCHPDTIQACGMVPDRAAVVGGRVRYGHIIIESSWLPWRRPSHVVVRLSGLRKGHAGKRFPARTRKQFEENEAFLNSAYSKGPDILEE